jgi:hypothetical protein
LKEGEIEGIASNLGYTVVYAGTLSFKEQISLFMGARQIAGVIGGGITNAIFSDPWSVMKLFVPPEMVDRFLWLIGAIKPHFYVEIVAIPCFQNRAGRLGYGCLSQAKCRSGFFGGIGWAS